MLPSTTAIERALHLLYDKYNIRYISCTKHFKAFPEGQMSKDKPTPLLVIKIYSFDVAVCHLFYS